MGYGSYSFVNSTAREVKYKAVERHELFTAASCVSSMQPGKRECRFSKDHPNAFPVIIALDVTGSMGILPERFIKSGMTTMMQTLYDAKLPDAQVLFAGIGDHQCDRAPLQVGQFESDDQLLDKWLKSIYLEGGGGAGDGESYFLAWAFASEMVGMDAKKGFIFTIGDEPCNPSIDGSKLAKLIGAEAQIYQQGATSEQLLDVAVEKFFVFHINVNCTRSGARPKTTESWEHLLGDNLLQASSIEMVPNLISSAIAHHTPSVSIPGREDMHL